MNNDPLNLIYQDKVDEIINSSDIYRLNTWELGFIDSMETVESFTEKMRIKIDEIREKLDLI